MNTLAIFDLDGTLLDTLDDLKDSLNAALVQNGLPERTKEQVRRSVGNGIRKLIERSVPEGTGKEQIDDTFAFFKSHYLNHCAVKTKPYPGILEMLKELRSNGIRIAVLSNKNDETVKKLCDAFFPSLIEIARGETDSIPKKPDPGGVYNIINELSSSVFNTVYIGDSEVDALTAGNAKTALILVGWGFRTKEELKKCGDNMIVSDPREITSDILTETVKQYNRKKL